MIRALLFVICGIVLAMQVARVRDDLRVLHGTVASMCERFGGKIVNVGERHFECEKTR